MNLSCSSRMIKYLMFGFNLFFVISGIIVIAVGAAVKTVYSEYAEFLDNKYFSLPNMLIATGAFIFMISFFGCCGAIKESWIMLGIFCVMLCIIFIFEFACGIAGYVLRDRTADFLESTLRGNLKNYNATHDIWDLIQGSFQCCGVDSYVDWEGVFNDTHDLPVSCCPLPSGTVGNFHCNSLEPTTLTPSTTISAITTITINTATPTANDSTPTTTVTTPSPIDSTTAHTNDAASRVKRAVEDDNSNTNNTVTTTPPSPPTSTSHPYTEGCKSAFGNYVKKHAVQIGGWGLGLAIIQILGIVFSCHLVRQLKYSYLST